MPIVILKHELLFLSILKPIKAAFYKAAFIGLRLSKNPPGFPTKGSQSAARIILIRWFKIPHWQTERYFFPTHMSR